MAEPIGPKFCVGPHMTPGKVYGCLKSHKFVLIFKMREIMLLNARTFWFVIFYEHKEKMLTDRATIKS